MKTLHLAIIFIVVAGISLGVLIMYNPIMKNTPLTTNKGYMEIDPQGLEKTYRTGQIINFSVLIQGLGTYPCLPPDIVIYNNDDKEKPVFAYVAQDVSCPDSSEHYSLYFPAQNNTFSTMVNQTGNYTLDVSLGNDSYQKQFSVIPSEENSSDVKIAVTKATFDIAPSGMPSLEKIPVIINGTNSDYSFNYTITGGEIEQAKADMINKELILSMKTTGNGTLIADLPRALIDSKINGQDSAFIVLEDGTEVRYNQTTTSQSRILSIQFQYGVSQIEITAPVPIQ